MFDLPTILIVTIAFAMAGGVKGVVGLGLPTISISVLTAAFDLTTGMALLIFPSLVTNFYQGFAGGHARALLARLWPFLFMASATVWIGARALTRVDLDLLTALLGLLLISYAGASIAGFRLKPPPGGETWTGIALGAVNGVFTGMTGSFAVPGVMFLQALGLPRDMLVQAMGMLFSVSTLALGLALERNDIMTRELGVASALAVIPALAGMVAGQMVRRRLSEAHFRRVFFVAILLLGAYILAKGLG